MGAKKIQEARILVVDDDEVLREALAFSFKRMGCHVLSAANGRDAFKLIQLNPVDVVISDIRMPSGDGIELLDRAKEACPETPIVLLVTGYTDISTEEAHNKGAEALFSKPFNQKDLQETIIRLLTPPEERWANPANRREAETVEVQLKAELQVPGLAAAIDAHVLNLGRGGMFVSLQRDQYPNINEVVSFKVAFEGSSFALEGTGAVKWVRTKSSPSLPPGCGIEFIYLSDEGKKRVLEYVNAQRPKAFIPSR